jgi:hypothetical protein
MSGIPPDLTTYTLEGALSLCLAVVAYKVYKMRITTESDCCKHCLRIRTVNRGDSNTDLEFTARQPPDPSQIV